MHTFKLELDDSTNQMINSWINMFMTNEKNFQVYDFFPVGDSRIFWCPLKLSNGKVVSNSMLITVSVSHPNVRS